MLTTDKLDQVRAARQKLTEALQAVDALLEDEPKTQPPSPRATELAKVCNSLEAHGETLDRLWS